MRLAARRIGGPSGVAAAGAPVVAALAASVATPIVAVTLAVALAGCAIGRVPGGVGAGAGAGAVDGAGAGPSRANGQLADPSAPELASPYRSGLRPVSARSQMAATANPLASAAAFEVLQAGGTAVDAAVAAQAVLGLVEPQSSGLGGGAFMLVFDARTRSVLAYDGRETAPAAATENHLRWVDDASDRSTPLPSARASGRSIGTPGTVRLLELAHRNHGRLAWRDLLQPGIVLATEGFSISGRLADAIAGARADLLRDAEAAATYLNADRSARPRGTRLRVPAYAATLRRLADAGADAFYTGPIAEAIVAKINTARAANDAGAITPGKTSLADLAAYRALRREPICTAYRRFQVCGMPPPSSGGLAVAATLGVLESFDLAALAPIGLDLEGGRPQVQAAHLVAEAERLAYADRDRYVADTDFVPLPGGSAEALLNKPYLRRRAALVSATRSLGTASAGVFGGVAMGTAATPEAGTSHVTIVDREGNAVALTTTVESGFGSFHMTQGFMLNNQLTDFSAAPVDAAGAPIANRVAPGKRPRSSMAPTLVFETAADGSRGELLLATGSAGGAAIIQHVVKTLVGVLDWGLDAQQASAMIDFGAFNGPVTYVGGEHPNVVAAGGGAGDALVRGLRALGHTVSVQPQSSGVATVRRTRGAGAAEWQGGVDPRREGLVLGDGDIVTAP